MAQASGEEKKEWEAAREGCWERGLTMLPKLSEPTSLIPNFLSACIAP